MRWFLLACIILVSHCNQYSKSACWHQKYSNILGHNKVERKSVANSAIAQDPIIRRVMVVCSDPHPFLKTNLQQLCAIFFKKLSMSPDNFYIIWNHQQRLEVLAPKVLIAQNDCQIIQHIADFIKNSNHKSYLIYFLTHNVKIGNRVAISIKTESGLAYITGMELYNVIHAIYEKYGPHPGVVIIDGCYSGAIARRLISPWLVVASSVGVDNLGFANPGGSIYANSFIRRIQEAACGNQSGYCVPLLQDTANITLWYYRFYNGQANMPAQVFPQLYVGKWAQKLRLVKLRDTGKIYER